MTKVTNVPANYNDIRVEIVELLKAACSTVARNVNSIMTAVYWEIGRKIVQSEQAGEKRAEYGDALIQRFAKDLSASFGRGFGPRNLAQMRSFFLAWPRDNILQTPSAKSPSLHEVQTPGSGQATTIDITELTFDVCSTAHVATKSTNH